MRSGTQWSLIIAFGMILAATAPMPLAAQDEEALDRTPEDCITVGRIRRTRIVDDKTILFYMRGGRTYQNILERNCPRLEREGRFMYEIRGYRLCDIDTITVLDRFGSGFGRGFTCRLGEFHPVTPEEAEAIERISEGEVEQDGVIEVEQVDLPSEAEQADQGGQAESD